MQIKKPFGVYLRDLRRSRGMSQKELADKLGVSSAQRVSNWERGYGTAMPVVTIRKIVLIFDVKSEDVLQVYIDQEKQKLLVQIESEWNSHS